MLQISEGLFTALNFSPELGVVMAGFAASALLAMIYLVPIALIVSYLRKFNPSKVLIIAMGLIWLASITAIGLAEATQTASLMTIATGTFVLATMGATILSVLHYIPRISQYIHKMRM